MKKKSERGITLIALIITIIVMLILVAVAVRVAVNSGLFGHAKNATTRWADEQNREGEISIDDQIKKYTNDGSEIYAALYSSGEGNILVFDNTADFEKENLIKIYTDETGKALNVNDLDITYYWASTEKKSIKKQEYSLCSNFTTMELNNSNDIKVIPTLYQPTLYTNIPWKEEFESIQFIKINSKIVPKYTKYLFAGLNSLVNIENIENVDTHLVKDMSGMFMNCESIVSLNLNSFDTSNVTNMSEMFCECSSLASLNLNSFDTSNVTNMSKMFCKCSSLASLNLSNFNTTKVTDMSAMFLYCENLDSLNLENFNTSNVISMYDMFNYCNKLISLDLTSFSTSKVTDMGDMFWQCSQLTSLDLSTFDITEETNLYRFCVWCENLSVIYVKNEEIKTILQENVPNSCQVIVKDSSTTV